MTLRFVTLDFESEFSDSFTLSKLSTEEYIRDPRFKAHGAAIKWSADTNAVWYDEPRLRWVLENEDWSDVFLISHHAHFDHLILSHHYSVVPRMSGCTLSMARLLLGNHLSVSLDNVRAHFQMPAKRTPYHLFKNKRWEELDQATQQLLAEGACDEVESIWKIFHILLETFPREELITIDTTVRMFTQPCLRADVDMLARIWEKEAAEKQRRLKELGIDETALQSAEVFKSLLEAEGVEVEYKDGKKQAVPCFAKTDPFMQNLLEDPNERVRTLAEARLAVKSTLLQTRAERLGFMAQRGPIPVYLRMYGAHTTRWSGGDGCLTQDTKVVVFDFDRGFAEKRIVDVLPDDLVWDGEEFVRHKGVVFSGYREVIEHDGIKGTPGHQVFTDAGTESLSEAMRRRARILDCPKPTRRQMEAVARGKYGPSVVPLRVRQGAGVTPPRSKR